jgi:hypothetical protein
VSYKRTLVFLVIFAALAAFFYFYEIKGGAERRLAEEQEKLLLPFEVEQATRLILRRAYDEIVLERPDGDWHITAPVSAPTEEGAIAQMLDGAAGLKFERDIGSQSDLEPFGLSEPELTLEIIGEQSAIGKILLGAETPDGGKLYVKLADGESVYAANKSIKAALDKTPFDLRDKKVVDFSAADVAAMAVVVDGSLFAFEKPDENGWAMTFPEEHRADAGRIRGLLDAIKNLRVGAFVEEEATDFGKYGLASPSTRIELNLISEIAVLYFGERIVSDDTEKVFARRNNSPQVLELAADILDNCSVDINDWRDRSMLYFEEEDVTKLEVISGAENTIVVRSEEDENSWRVIEPEPADADKYEVEDMLKYLGSTKVIRFISSEESGDAAKAIETPMAQVTLWTDRDEIPLTLILAEREEGELYTRTDPDGEFSIVHAGLMEAVLPEARDVPERFKDKSVIKFAAADVESMEISKGDTSYSLKREDVQWDVPEDFDLEGYEVGRFLWDLQELDYSTVTPRDRDDSFYGFDPPTLTIILRSATVDGELKLTIGERIPERESLYALGGDERTVMEIDEGFATKWFDRF